MAFKFPETKESMKVFFFYFRKYRKFYLIGIFSLVVVDGLEVVPPLLMKWAVDVLSENHATSSVLAHIAGLFMLVAVVQGFMRYLWRKYIVRTSMMASNDMRSELFFHVSGLAPGFFKKNRVGDLVSMSTNDIEAIRFALGPGALVMADACFYFLTIPPVMIWLSPKLALISLVPMLLVPKFVRIMEAKIQKHFKIVQDRFSDLAAHCQESLGGIRIIKGGALEPFKEREFSAIGEQYIQANVKAAITQSTLNTVLELFVSSATTLLFLVGGSLVIHEKLTIGIFVAFQKYIQKMSWPMEAFGMGANIFQRSMASQKRVDHVLQEKNTIEVAGEKFHSHTFSQTPKIEVRNLRFTYPGKTKPALDGISFILEPGMKMGLAGRVGSGKSTLLNCLSRMEPIAAGQIFFDGIDATKIPVQEIRRWMGIVPQEIFLFSHTIEDNILYGSDLFLSGHAELRLAKATSAAKLASVHEEVLLTPHAYQSMLGERGVNLSGGQKQRLTIARALARDPKILLLDDCLSAVDMETESALIRSLRGTHGSTADARSLVISSHRLSCMQHLDWVLVLDEGKIIAQGKPSDLQQNNAIFQGLFERQERAELWELRE